MLNIFQEGAKRGFNLHKWYLKYPLLGCRGRGLGFDPHKGRNVLFFKILPDTRRDCEAEPQPLISVQNMPGLNPKSLCSAYDVKA